MHFLYTKQSCLSCAISQTLWTNCNTSASLKSDQKSTSQRAPAYVKNVLKSSIDHASGVCALDNDVISVSTDILPKKEHDELNEEALKDVHKGSVIIDSSSAPSDL